MWTGLAQHPLLVAFLASVVLALCLRTWWRRRVDVARGWRVRTEGFDARYEEWLEGRWQGLSFVNRPLPGRSRREIHLPSALEWAAQPDWLRDRRDEILARIRESCPPSLYDYASDAATHRERIEVRKPPLD